MRGDWFVWIDWNTWALPLSIERIAGDGFSICVGPVEFYYTRRYL